MIDKNKIASGLLEFIHSCSYKLVSEFYFIIESLTSAPVAPVRSKPTSSALIHFPVHLPFLHFRFAISNSCKFGLSAV